MYKEARNYLIPVAPLSAIGRFGDSANPAHSRLCEERTGINGIRTDALETAINRSGPTTGKNPK